MNLPASSEAAPEATHAAKSEAALNTAADAVKKDSKKSVSFWVAGALLKFVGIKDAPDSVKDALGTFIFRFGWLLVFGVMIPPLCALFLMSLDKAGGISATFADKYRDYVVSGFGINESIYKADKERIDYLIQMRKVNFLEEDESGIDPSVMISAIPGQEGNIVIERALLIQKSLPPENGAGGTAESGAGVIKSSCPKQTNPRLSRARVVVWEGPQREQASPYFELAINQILAIDKNFWKNLKIDSTDSSSVKTLHLMVLPPNANQTAACFDLFVDLRAELFKTKSK